VEEGARRQPLAARNFTCRIGIWELLQPQIATLVRRSASAKSVSTCHSFEAYRVLRAEISRLPSDCPVVQLRSMQSGQTTLLHAQTGPRTPWSPVPVWGFPPGCTLVTVFVNGIPSTSVILTSIFRFLFRRLSLPRCAFPTVLSLFLYQSNWGILKRAGDDDLALPSTNWKRLWEVSQRFRPSFQFIEPKTSNILRDFTDSARSDRGP